MVRETVEEVETGYKIEIKHKRGTGTRDQDTITAAAKTETLEELREERTELRSAVIEEMEALREHQPDADGGGDA